MKSALPKKTSFLYWFSYFLIILPFAVPLYAQPPAPPATIPNAPTIGIATATGATTATVAFTAPTNNGGSPILRYVATSSPGGITGIFTGAGSGTITITGLTSNTSYNFTVIAENAVGASIPSNVSNWVVPVRGPNEPTNVVAVAGNEQATISFTPPTDDGGTPIFIYKVVASPGNIMMSGASSPIIVPGLTNGTAYTFVVSAENSNGGQGTPSAPSNSVTPGTPGAPTIGYAYATGPNTAKVAFTAVSNNGGSAITSYEVTSSPAGGTGTFNGAGSGTISVSNLTHSTNYTFTVKARNIHGFGNASAASNQIRTTTPTAPDAPTIGSATATGSTTATVAFTAPSNNGGSAITSYAVTSSPAGGTGTFNGAGSGTISVSNLAPGTSYTLTVKAVNEIGSSIASAASNQITTSGNLALPVQPMVAGQPILSKFTAVGADAGGGPLVTITFNNGTYVSFFAYASTFTGGVRVALGDINGDGNMDVITGAGPGGGPQVNVYNVNPATGGVSLQNSFFAFNAPSFRGGIYVATGRTNSDIYEDIIVGAGATGGSRVQVYAGSANGVVTTSTLNDFFAYSPAFTGGVRVAAGDRDGDWIDEVITAPASNGGYNIKSFKTNDKGNSPNVFDNFFAFNNTTSVGGLSIASGYLNSGNISDIIVGTSNGGFGVIIDSNTAGIAAIPFPGFTGTINVGVAQDANGIIYPMALVGPSGGPKVNVYKTGASSLVETDNLFVMNVAFTGGLFGTPSIKSFENYAPTNISLSNETISENNAIGASIGTLSSTDPNLGDSFTYSLVSGIGSTDNSKFYLSENTLKAAAAFDFETKSSYKIRIQTSDVGGLSFQKEFTITIVNVNEVPTAIALSNETISENNAIGASIGTLSSTDQDVGDSFTYSLVSGTGSTDNSKFTIAGNTLKALEAFDFETKSSYKIRIQTSDVGGLSFQKEFTMTIVNVNEVPTAIALSNETISENNAIGASIGTLSSTDQDVDDSFTYSLVSGTGSTDNSKFTIGSTDNSKFTIAGNTLKAVEAFDFETKSSYSIRVRTTDAGGLSFEKAFTITVLNVNETPSALTINKSNLYESNTINEVIGVLSTIDQDAGDSHTYSLVSGVGSTDNAAFNVSGNQIRASQVYSFSTKNWYSIRIRTTDKGGLSFESVYAVSVSQLPTLTGTGNEYGTQLQTIASTTPKISKGFTSQLIVSGSDVASYNWSPSASLSSASIYNPIAKPSQTQSYSVRVTNVYGSSTTLSITVEVMEDFNIVATNLLTPNGDGQNDKWEIENLSSYPNNQLVIMDRSGRVIYRKIGYANDWDGLYNGAPLPSDTYYFLLTFDSDSGKIVSKRGYITITK
jgi:gliding motility-associated-like protein